MLESELLRDCFTKFENLGWEVSTEYEFCQISQKRRFRPDLTLRYHGNTYGFVEVIVGNIKEKIELYNSLLSQMCSEERPYLFIVTNGYIYDIYDKGQLFVTLTTPPSPEDVALIRG